MMDDASGARAQVRAQLNTELELAEQPEAHRHRAPSRLLWSRRPSRGALLRSTGSARSEGSALASAHRSSWGCLDRRRGRACCARVALANQLRAELERCWPGPIGVFFAIDSPISLAFLARYPSPLDARGLGEKRMAGFLKAHGYNNRKTPAQLLERLRSAPTGRAGEIETRTRRQIVLHLTSTLQVMVEQIRGLESEIAEALRAHPDGEIFRSFFHSPDCVICAATLLGEIGDCRGRYP